MGGGAFIVAQRGTVYVTPGPYLPIAKRYARIARNRSKSKPDRQGMRRRLSAATDDDDGALALARPNS